MDIEEAARLLLAMQLSDHGNAQMALSSARSHADRVKEACKMTATLIGDALSKTSLMQPEQIQQLFRMDQDIQKVLIYKNMSREMIWLDCTHRVSSMVQGIIGFSMMVPGFKKLLHDDQIVLVKSSAFEMVVIRLSRYIDLSTGQLLIAEAKVLLPENAFYTHDITDMKLITAVFELAKSIAEFKLTDVQLGLYSSLVLICPDRVGLSAVPEVRRINDLVLHSLKSQLDSRIVNELISKISMLRDVSRMHMDALAPVKRSKVYMDFHILYKELFSVGN